jgi:hypothetical protein
VLIKKEYSTRYPREQRKKAKALDALQKTLKFESLLLT